MKDALNRLQGYRERAARVGVSGHREYNGGWHTAIDLNNLLTVAEAITLSAIERKESRGGHFRDDFPEKSAEYATFNLVITKDTNGEMKLERSPIPPMPPELKAIIEEMK
jgi:succinate dehydrogenase / fumarate reductase flavoprotein subunit